MKVRMIRWYNALLTALLSMLGYSCSSDEILDEYGTPVEYGSPNVNYVVKGTVTDEGGTPVQGIKVSLIVVYDNEYYDTKESVNTDATGRFQLNETENVSIGYGEVLIVEDIDGEANGGEFRSDTLNVADLDRKQVKEGDGHWYSGKYELSANIKLKKK